MTDASSRRRPIKRLGQNFLIDESIINQIIDSAKLNTLDVVLEPGPGRGALTKRIAERAGKVIAVEKDPLLARELNEQLSHQYNNVIVIQGDVLRVELPNFNKVVSTPPYYISSKLVLLLTKVRFELASLVLQKEFGERLAASPGSSEYGRISVLANRFFNIQMKNVIPRTAFRPRPKVDSIHLIIQRKNVSENVDEGFYSNLVRGIFTQRRRIVYGAVRHFLFLTVGSRKGKIILERMKLPEKRVYQLSPEEIEDIAIQLRSISETISTMA